VAVVVVIVVEVVIVVIVVAVVAIVAVVTAVAVTAVVVVVVEVVITTVVVKVVVAAVKDTSKQSTSFPSPLPLPSYDKVALKDCSHIFCRMCIFEMVQSCLHLGNINPCCPLCRTEIERMTDLVKQKELAENIFGQFPEEVMMKVSTTHSLAKQKEVAANIKLLAELLFEAATDSLNGMRGGQRGSGVGSSSDSSSGSSGGGSSSTTALRPAEEGDEDFLLLTVELVCLIYSVFVFLFLAWVRISNYII